MTPPTLPPVIDRLAGGPQGPDVVVLDIAILEQPPADPYLDGELWPAVDEQPVPLDRKAALDDNGFRVGVIGGMPAPRLQELLTSERWCKAHRVSLHSGHAKALPIGPAQGDCEFDFRINSETKPQKFVQAQCGVGIVSQRMPDGRVRIVVTPQITHGGRSIWLQPAEGQNWSITGQRPVEQFAGLSLEATISPHEYLLVGTRYDRTQTLGHLTFVNGGVHPAQRLLLIRARPQEDANAKPTWSKDSAAPLAYQASKSARGKAE
jgi:hypothetical protein